MIGSLYVCAPVVATPVVFRTVVPAESVVRLPSAAVPPTIPFNVTVPFTFNVSCRLFAAASAFTVEPNETP